MDDHRRKIVYTGNFPKPYMLVKPLDIEECIPLNNRWEKVGTRYTDRGIVSVVDSNPRGFKFVIDDEVSDLLEFIRRGIEDKKARYMRCKKSV